MSLHRFLRPAQHGVALISALLISALVATLAITLVSRTNLWLNRAHNKVKGWLIAYLSESTPPTMALREEPLPRWQMMNLQSSGFLPRNFGVSPAMKRWLVPWKP